jgi:hypothetical protein
VVTVSDNATDAIRQIVTQPDVPQGSGLRIAADPAGSTLQVAVSPMPHPGDTVLDAVIDAPLFLSAEADALLSDKVIDAEMTGSGQVQFIVQSSIR